MADHSSFQLLITDWTHVDTKNFCLLQAIWFAFKDPPPSPSQSTLFKLDAPHSWAPRVHTWPGHRRHSDAPNHPNGTHSQEPWRGWIPRAAGGHQIERTYLREDAQGQAILREEKKQGWRGRDRDLMALFEALDPGCPGALPGVSRYTLLWSHTKKIWAPVTRQESWIRHPWCLRSNCLIRHLHSYPSLLKLWWQEPWCGSVPEPGPPGRTHGASEQQLSFLVPGPSSTKQQFSNRHPHSTPSSTHLPSQRPPPQVDN